MFTIVEEAGDQRGICLPFSQGRAHVFERARAPRGDDRNIHRIGNFLQKLDVVSVFRPVFVHRGEEYFARSALFSLPRPCDNLQRSLFAAAFQEHFVCTVFLFRVYRNDDALLPEGARGIADEVGILHGGGIERDFVCPKLKQSPYLLDGADAPAYREWNEDLLCHRRGDVEYRLAPFLGWTDIEKNNVIRALFGILFAERHRITDHLQVDERDTLDHLAVLDVEARNDALG